MSERPAFCAAVLLVLSLPASAALRTEKLSRRLASGVSREVEVVSGQAFVKFSSRTAAQVQAALALIGASPISDMGLDGWWQVGLSTGMPVGTGLSLLLALSGVESIQPNKVYRPLRTPNDPLVNNQYALSQINAFDGWNYEIGSSSRATIAVIDTGIDPTVPDLTAKLVAGHRFCPPGGGACAADVPIFACNHGTRVSGIAAAATNNGAGIAGVSWDAQLLSIRVFTDGTCAADCGGAGCVTDDAAIINALNYLVTLQNSPTHGKVVANLSLGESGSTCDNLTQTAMNNAVNAGIVVVAAAGNDGGAVNEPANCLNVIPVAATDQLGNIAAFSSRGAALSSYGIAAPGVDVLTTDVGAAGATATPDGTSFASPHAAGLAALILSAKPTLTPAEVRNIMRQSANNIGLSGLDAAGRPLSHVAGAGRINVFMAMQLTVRGRLADFQGEEKVVAFPNPFRTNEASRVFFAIPPGLQADGAKLKIYTVNGELVRDLNSLAWDGRNKDGGMVASGTYVFVYKNDRVLHRGRVAVIR